MIELNDFLKHIDNQTDIYIRFKGERLSVSLEYFKMKHPNNWDKYSVYIAKCDGNDLIIDIYKV